MRPLKIAPKSDESAQTNQASDYAGDRVKLAVLLDFSISKDRIAAVSALIERH
jgi:hypothetical protein